jgi:hypothetical protein
MRPLYLMLLTASCSREVANPLQTVGIASPPPPTRVAKLEYVSLGTRIGASGMVAQHTSAGTRLVTTIHNDTGWAAFRDDGAGGLALVHAVFLPSATPLKVLTVGNLRGGPDHEVLTIDTVGRATIHGAHRLRPMDTWTLPEWVDACVCADLDGDGRDELIVASGSAFNPSDLVVFSATGQELHRFAGMGGDVMAVGQLDGDPGLEIATNGGFVIDADTAALQWDRGGPFGTFLTVADTDGDGVGLLLTASWGQNGVRAFDVVAQQEAWFEWSVDVEGLFTADLDDDGDDEWVVAAAYGAAVAYAPLGLLWWGPVVSIMRMHGFLHEDLDGDGVGELYFAGGDFPDSYGPQRNALVRADAATQQVTWRHLDTQLAATPLVGDIDGDGVDDRVGYGQSPPDSATPPGPVVFDPTWREVVAVGEPAYWALNGAGPPKLIDLDGDGDVEQVLPIGERILAHDFAPDGTWDEIVLMVAAPAPVSKIATVDLFEDGVMDIVGATKEGLVAVDFVGTPTWSYSWPPDSWSPRAMAVGDTDGDGQPELLVARYSDEVEVFDVLTGTVRQVLPVRATHIEVVAATPPWTILADATSSATAWRHDGQQLSLVRTDVRPWQAVYQPAPGVLAWVGWDEVEVQGGPQMQVLLRATLSGDSFSGFAPTVDPLTGDLMMWSGRGLYRLVR